MPTEPRRRDLEASGVVEPDHAALYKERYLHAREDMTILTHLERVCEIPTNAAYKGAYGRWLQQGGALPSPARFQGVSLGPLAVGLGNESVLEVGLTLHHTYGMPLIPGQALKGICRRAAERLCTAGSLKKEERDALLGTTRAASHLVFWDAWYDPDSAGGKPLGRDVITPHHSTYYRTHGEDAWPTDFDDPIPVPFLVVRPGARFLFTVSGPTAAWSAFAAQLLRWGLENLGAGGKTNAGYGFFGDWQELVVEEPPRQEIWRGCALTRAKGGTLTLDIESDAGRITLVQKTWQPLEQKLSVEEKAALRRGRLLADVQVRIESRVTHFESFLSFRILDENG